MIFYHNLYFTYINSGIFWLILSNCLITKTSKFTMGSTSTVSLICQLRYLQSLEDIQNIFCDGQDGKEVV